VITIEIALDLRLFCAVAWGLLAFGVVFNDFVTRAGEHKDGYTWLLVVVGVLVTLLGVALISWQAAVLTLIAFVASGIPMIVGDVARYVGARRDAMARQREELRHE